ncbi:MAG: hypothetical protein NTX03_06030 [Bacteroidetes bacterium]|nr:hypothetical protein [Bacteroidota bacterium]
MKKNLLMMCLITLLSYQAFAQSPQAIPYQAVARNSSGVLIANQSISLRFSIRAGTATGTVVYKETQTATTNKFGSFSVNIGKGTVVTGTFSSIRWDSASKFMQVELDAAGGTSYTDMGTQQMLSVPYALFATATPAKEYMYAAYVASGTGLTVTSGNAFTFNNITSSSNITISSSKTLKVLVAGVYQISYYVTDGISGGRTIGLKVNSATATNTVISLSSNPSSPYNIGSTVILVLKANDTIQLINAGSSSMTTTDYNVIANISITQL